MVYNVQWSSLSQFYTIPYLGFFAGAPLLYTWCQSFLKCGRRFHDLLTPIFLTLKPRVCGQSSQVLLFAGSGARSPSKMTFAWALYYWLFLLLLSFPLIPFHKLEAQLCGLAYNFIWLAHSNYDRKQTVMNLEQCLKSWLLDLQAATETLAGPVMRLLDSLSPLFCKDTWDFEGLSVVYVLHLGRSILQSLIVCTLASCRLLS